MYLLLAGPGTVLFCTCLPFDYCIPKETALLQKVLASRQCPHQPKVKSAGVNSDQLWLCPRHPKTNERDYSRWWTIVAQVQIAMALGDVSVCFIQEGKLKAAEAYIVKMRPFCINRTLDTPYVHLPFTVPQICTIFASYRGLHLPSNLFKSLKNTRRFSFRIEYWW